MKFLIALMFMGTAYADSPMECFKAALLLKDSYNSLLTQQDAISLCAGSYDMKPVECFKNAMAYKDNLGVSIMTKNGIFLCSKKLMRNESI